MIAYAFVLCLSRLLSLLPLRLSLLIGRGAGMFTFHVLRLRRKVVLDNIRRGVGAGLSPAEVRAIGSETYTQCAQTFVEILCASTKGESGLEANVTYDSLEFLEGQRAAGVPVLLVQPHLGNFDLAAYAFAKRGFPLHTVMKKIRNRRLHDLIVGTREQHNITVHFNGKGTYGTLLELLRGGAWLGVLPDQRPRKGKGVEVEFLGRTATMFPGPAVYHLETGARICLAWDERLADPLRHHVHVHPLDAFTATGDRDADVRSIMQQIADVMAGAIRAHPGHYFWFHRLWREADVQSTADELRASLAPGVDEEQVVQALGSAGEGHAPGLAGA